MSMIIIISQILIIAFSIILHECAHGWVANRLGDPTAKDAGRLSLNPLKHIDPIGTVALPGLLMILRHFGYNVFLFGWAKPVPVNFMRLRNPRRDMMWVGLAGPMTNILLALFFRGILFWSLSEAWVVTCTGGILINLLLAVFNIMPIPPLDGSRVVMGLIPRRMFLPYAKIEPYGFFIVILLFQVGLFEFYIWPTMEYLGKIMGVIF
ncbi:MAG: site-2 protease family protein [Candidatus Omnitrophica bacterium]|nr:site-2 protease family protein [Candidatus Omnitrophota bacterium]